MPLFNDIKSDEGHRLISKVTGLLKDGVQDRSRHDKAWDTYINYAASKHWSEDWTAGRSRPSINVCAKVIRSTTPLLVDRRPQFEVMPVAGEHYETADILNACTQYVLYHQRFQRSLAANLLVSQTVGTNFFEVVNDVDLADQRGDIAVRKVLPWDVLALGGDDVQDCEMVAVRRKLPISRIRRLYGENAKGIEPNVDPSQASNFPHIVFGHGGMHPTTFATGGRVETYGTKTRDATDGDFGYIWEVYFRDEQTYQDTQDMLVSGMVRELVIDKLKYPGGWRMITFSGNTVLYDGPMPYKHLQVPLIKTANYDIPGEFWGESDLQNIVQPNKIINVILGQVIDALRLGNNPPLLVPNGSGVNVNTWLNWPGMIAQYNPQGGAPHWMDPQRISPEAFRVMDLCLQYIYDIAGLSEISEGGVPFAGASGELVAQLREAAMTRIRLKTQNMEDAISQIGQQVVGLIQEFWTDHKMLRVTGLLPNDKLTKLSNIKPGPDGRMAYLPLNQHTTTEGVKLNDLSIGKYDVRVVTGSTLAKSHRQLLSDTISLAQVGLYNAEDMAIVLDDPRKDVIIARVREQEAMQKQQQAAMMQQAGAQAPQIPGLPPPQGGEPGPLPEDLSNAVGRM